MPVTPLPDGSGVTTGTLGPQDTTSWSFASSYQRTFSSNAAQRAAHRRHAAHGRPHGGAAGQRRRRRRSNLPGIPSTAQFPEHAADVSHRRLSAARIAAEHGDRLQHQRDRDRRHADLAEGPAHGQGGRRPALGAAERVQPPSPTGSFTFSNLFSDLPGTAEHRHAARQLPARPGAAVLDRPAAGRDPQSRALPGVLRPGRLAGLRSPDGQRRRCATR